MYKCFKVLLVGALIVPMISTLNVSAATMPKSYNNMTTEEKQAFDKLYKSSATSELKDVKLKYTTEVTGKENVNNYHWTIWRNSVKGSSVDKKANSGKGVGSGNYSGFTKAKINSWKTDQKYIDAIKEINNGKFPESRDYTYPMDTSSPKASIWVDKVGFYNILGDPRYSKVTAKGYRTYTWTEKVKKEKIVNESKTKFYKPEGYGYKSSSLNLGYDRAPGTTEDLSTALLNRIRFIEFDSDNSKAYISSKNAKNLADKLINSMEWNTPSGKPEDGEANATYQMNATVSDGTFNISVAISGQRQDAGTPRLAVITVKKDKTETYYETVSHTSKQQIAQTVLARNAYATAIKSYKTFYLVPKSSVKSNKIATYDTGFWMKTTPYYHTGDKSTTDEGSYGWTFSNQVTSGKASIILNASIKEKHKFIEDFADNILHPEDMSNPPLNPGGNNNGGGSSGGGDNGGTNPGGGTDKPGGGTNPGGDNGGNGNGTNPGGGGSSIIGDKDNQPMVNIEIDLDNPNNGVIRVPSMFHLIDIYGNRY